MYEPEKAVLFIWVASMTVISFIGVQLSISQTSKYSLIPVPNRAATTTEILKRVAEAYRSGDVVTARTMAVEIKEEPVRKQAIDLVRFREAKTAIESHDLEMANRLAQAGTENLHRAVTECGELSPHLRARLLAVAVRLSLAANRQYGDTTLRQAVMEYRMAKKDGAQNQAAQSNSVGRADESFYEVVNTGSGQSYVFPLHMPGVPDASLGELALDYYPVAGGTL